MSKKPKVPSFWSSRRANVTIPLPEMERIEILAKAFQVQPGVIISHLAHIAHKTGNDRTLSTLIEAICKDTVRRVREYEETGQIH